LQCYYAVRFVGHELKVSSRNAADLTLLEAALGKRAMKASSSAPVCFGLFEFNPQSHELRKHGLKIKLGLQACKVLALLLESSGQARTREELRLRLWPDDTFVDFEHSLNKAIHDLRAALGDSARSPRYIETVAGVGYRFIPIPEVLRASSVPKRNRRKIDSLAVLPLATDPADAEAAFVNKSITERVIDTISRISRTRVLAYSAVRHCREEDLDPQAIGQRLSVRAVTMGEMLRRNDRFLLHMELLDVADGSQLWGAQFKESRPDVLDWSEKVADEVCAQLRPILLSNVSRKIMKLGEKREHLKLAGLLLCPFILNSAAWISQ